jgi:hypothetical protein
VIEQHAANTAWLGTPAGVVTDARFFALPAGERDRLLAPYAIVEFKHPLATVPPAASLIEAGFGWVDVQIEFRIGLGRIDDSPSLQELEVRFADDTPFTIADGETKSFEEERFVELPGMTQEALDRRYTSWARQLIAEHPTTSLQVLHRSKPQGWFLSRPSDHGLNLLLAMLHRDATISGMLLYQKGLRAYAARGHSLGWAGCSVRNVNVHNIYSRLGARFTPAVGCWLWVRRQQPE